MTSDMNSNSAVPVIRERASVVVIRDDKILGFRAEDPHNKKKYFFLPGGLIEKGETAVQAAQRETFEETGYKIEVLPHVCITRDYRFEWNGQVYDCTTQFFAGSLLGDEPVPVADAAYHRGVEWQPVRLIPSLFAYHCDILEPVQLITARLQSAAHGS